MAAQKRTGSLSLLRVHVEGTVPTPGVISVTSGKLGDRQTVAAQGLAAALANAGYKTLLIDTSVPPKGYDSHRRSLSIPEMAALSPTDGSALLLSEAAFTDADFQEKMALTTLREVLDDLRRRFDYIIIETESALASSFALNVMGLADAVLVSIRKGRRLCANDSTLANMLNSEGARFLGIIAIDKSITETRRTSTAIQPVKRLAGEQRSPSRSQSAAGLFEPPSSR